MLLEHWDDGGDEFALFSRKWLGTLDRRRGGVRDLSGHVEDVGGSDGVLCESAEGSDEPSW